MQALCCKSGKENTQGSQGNDQAECFSQMADFQPVTNDRAQLGGRDDSQDNRYNEQPFNLAGEKLAEKSGKGGKQDNGKVGADGYAGRNADKGCHQRDQDERAALADHTAQDTDRACS